MPQRRSLWFRGGGSPHRGWYRHIWCDSAWELAVVIWHQEHGHEIVRCTEDFPYPLRGKTLYYRPDFIIDGEYVEVKGVMDGRSKRKIDHFPLPIRVIKGREAAKMIDYARSRYGDDYWRLLESPA